MRKTGEAHSHLCVCVCVCLCAGAGRARMTLVYWLLCTSCTCIVSMQSPREGLVTCIVAGVLAMWMHAEDAR